MTAAAATVERRAGLIRPASLVWLACHELRLSWREWRALMTAGNRRFTTSAGAVDMPPE